jgi:hypothetical protein
LIEIPKGTCGKQNCSELSIEGIENIAPAFLSVVDQCMRWSELPINGPPHSCCNICDGIGIAEPVSVWSCTHCGEQDAQRYFYAEG